LPEIEKTIADILKAGYGYGVFPMRCIYLQIIHSIPFRRGELPIV
jgi:hypothetical protein